MKHIRRIFSLAMVVCVAFLEIAPALPAHAFDTVEIDASKVGVSLQTQKREAEAKDSQEKTDWSTVDWDSEVVLLPDLQVFQQEMNKFLAQGKSNEAKNLFLKKTKMSSDEAMEYYQVPTEIREAVRQYQESKGIFAQDRSKEFLKNYIKSLLPTESLSAEKSENLAEHFLDISQAPRLEIKNLKAEGNSTEPIDFKIFDRKFKVQKHPLQNATVRGISERVKRQGLTDRQINVEVSMFTKIKNLVADLFKIETANAETATDLIVYYNGIEKNTLDNALYYISRSQTASGTFFQATQYEETAETALALASAGRTNSAQFSDALNYLINAEPQNIRELAIKARLMESLGQPYQAYLDEFIANENSDHGYGLDAGYESDILTTMEGALAMYTAGYSLQDKLPLSLYYVLSQIPADGALKYEAGGPASYYLINKIAQYLEPFKTMTVANDQGVNITVQSKINALLGYLSSQFDDDNQKLSGTLDAIDEIMTLKTWQMYGVEQARQKVLETKLTESQYVDGSFDNSLRATVYALETLDKPDLTLANLQSNGILQSRQDASFSLTIENKGYAPATDAVIYIFPDNVYTGLSLNLGMAGIAIEPNETININFTIPASETNKYTGEVNLKLYIEPSADINFDDNWLYSAFNFAPAADGTPALPMYYAVFKYSLNGNPAVIATIPAVQKTDPNRSGYALLFKEHSATSWQWTSYNPNLYIIGYFPEGAYYDFTLGVINVAGTDITYFSDITTIHLSANDNLYTGSASGRITLDNQNMPNTYAFIQAGFSTTTDANGQFFKSGGQNGRIAAWVDKAQYEQIRETFNVQEGQTTQNVRIFTHLKADSIAPTLSSVELRYASNYRVKTQKEYSLFAWGSDNAAVKEGDFYYWDPTQQIWAYIGTSAFANGSANWKWFVPQDLPFATGYKIKAVLRDYRGNQSEAKEWGPFEIIDGTPPSFTVLSPNGGEQLSLNTTTTISWTTQSINPVNNVRIYIYYPTTNQYISSNVPNTGTYNWQIPNSSSYLGSAMKIRVYGTDSVNLESGYDESDGYFSISDGTANVSEPWTGSVKITTSTDKNPAGGYVYSTVSRYDSQGKLHLIYRYNKDYYDNGVRTIADQLYYLVKSADGVWSTPQIIYEQSSQTDGNLTGYQPINDLNLVIDSNDHPHLAWQYGSSGGCDSFNLQEIGYMYFDGTAWSAPQNLSNNNSTSQSPTLAVNNNSVYAAWVDGRTWDANCSSTGTTKINLSSKSLAGGSWSSPELLSPDKYLSNPKLAATLDGRLHLAFVAGDQNKTLHYYRTGSTWSSLKELFSVSVDSPDLSLGKNNTLHYVGREYYQDPTTSQYRSRILYSFYDGASWSTSTEASPAWDNYSAEYPKVVSDANNQPQIVFQHYNQADYKKKIVWTARSYGNNWLNPAPLTYDSQYPDSSYYSLASHGNKISLAYTSYYSFLTELYYNEADLDNDYTIPEGVDGLVVSSTLGGVILNWDQHVDNYGDFDHFAVYRADNDVALIDELEPVVVLNSVTATSYIDYGVEQGKDYYYGVVAYDASGHGSSLASWTGPVAGIFIPEIELTQNSLTLGASSAIDFGSLRVGSNLEKTFVIQNKGNGSLQITSLSLAGNNCSAFSLVGQAPDGLLPMASSTFSIQFNPQIVDLTDCYLSLDSNSGINSSYYIGLNATVLPVVDTLVSLPFDEQVGALSFNDNSGNSLTAVCPTSSTCPLAGVNGKTGKAIKFDGKDDSVSVGASVVISPRQAITIEAWVKPDTTSGDNTPWMVVASKGLDYELTVSKNGVVYASLVNETGARVSLSIGGVLTMNEWNHLVLTYDSINIKVYVNGVLKGTKPQTGSIKSNKAPLEIGKYGNNYHYKGSLDELKLYGVALSETEVLAHYNASPVVPFSGPLEFSFEEGVDMVEFIDHSGEYKATCASSVSCPAVITGGKVNKGIKFDGSDDTILVPHSDLLSPTEALTLEAWIKPDTTSGDNTPWMVLASKGLDYELTVSKSRTLYASLVNQSGTRAVISVGNALTMNEWNHLAFTYDGTNLKVYVNGVLKGTKPQTGSIKSNKAPLEIGKYGNNYHYKGSLDELKFYQIALSEEEILVHYNASPVVPFDGPLEFSFAELTSSSVFVDFTEDYKLSCVSTSTCPVAEIAGRNGNAIQLDGTNDYLSMGNINALNPTQALTLETWIKPSTTSADNTPWMIVANKALNYELTVSKNGVVYASLVNEAGIRASLSIGGVLIMNEWNHLVLTYDGANLKVYVNGVLKGTKPQTGSIKSSSAPLEVGKYGNNYHFSGLIDYFKLYKTVLPAEEVLAHFNTQ